MRGTYYKGMRIVTYASGSGDLWCRWGSVHKRIFARREDGKPFNPKLLKLAEEEMAKHLKKVGY